VIPKPQPLPIDFYWLGHMKNVYQPKIETQDALMCRILDAAVPDKDSPNELMQATCSIHRHGGVY
jgi:hypothetical protein